MKLIRQKRGSASSWDNVDLSKGQAVIYFVTRAANISHRGPSKCSNNLPFTTNINTYPTHIASVVFSDISHALICSKLRSCVCSSTTAPPCTALTVNTIQQALCSHKQARTLKDASLTAFSSTYLDVNGQNKLSDPESWIILMSKQGKSCHSWQVAWLLSQTGTVA